MEPSFSKLVPECCVSDSWFPSVAFQQAGSQAKRILVRSGLSSERLSDLCVDAQVGILRSGTADDRTPWAGKRNCLTTYNVKSFEHSARCLRSCVGFAPKT